MHVPHSQHSTVLAMQTTSKEHFPITDEPLTNMWTERRQWVEAQGLQTALAYKSWLHSTTSNNTLVKMQKKEKELEEAQRQAQQARQACLRLARLGGKTFPTNMVPKLLSIP